MAAVDPKLGPGDAPKMPVGTVMEVGYGKGKVFIRIRYPGGEATWIGSADQGQTMAKELAEAAAIAAAIAEGAAS